jgi:hypothetical protein
MSGVEPEDSTTTVRTSTTVAKQRDLQQSDSLSKKIIRLGIEIRTQSQIVTCGRPTLVVRGNNRYLVLTCHPSDSPAPSSGVAWAGTTEVSRPHWAEQMVWVGCFPLLHI